MVYPQLSLVISLEKEPEDTNPNRTISRMIHNGTVIQI